MNLFVYEPRSGECKQTLVKYAGTPEEKYERNKKQMKIVEIDGKIYYGLSEAARQFGITPGAMLNRIKSSNYPTYRYI